MYRAGDTRHLDCAADRRREKNGHRSESSGIGSCGQNPPFRQGEAVEEPSRINFEMRHKRYTVGIAGYCDH